MNLSRRIFLAGICVLALAGCGNNGALIGSTVKGTRVAVMEEKKTVEADKDLEDFHLDLSESVANTNWPQAGYDPLHILPNSAMSEHPEEIWSSSIGDGSNSDYKLLARPVVNNGMVFTMDSQGLVRAFDVKDGDRKWSFDTTPPDSDTNAIGGGVGADGDAVFATTGFGEVIALSAVDGKVRWRKPLGNPLRAAPTIADGKVYVVSIDNQLSALDAHSGDVLWHHNGIAESATLMGASNPAVTGDSVVVAYSSGEIFNLRAENGRASWNYALTTPTQVGALPAIADIRGLPIIDRGHVIAISHSGRVASIDHRTGDRNWESDVGGINTPVVSGNVIYILSNDGQLISLLRETGRILFVQELQQREDPTDHDSDPVFWTGPVMGNNVLWLTNSLGQLVSFSPKDGSQLLSIDIDEPSFIPPVIAGNVIYVVTDDGELVALR